MTTTLLLDTSSLMFRAFFSVPASIVGRDRKPVNAVHGYLDMTARLYDRFHPDDCVHVFDNDWRPAPRVAIYDGYKSTRQPDPEGLPEQFDLLREVLDAAGLAHAESPGWEAEDAIGALTALGGRNDRFEIVTGDRDLIQLVRDPAVRVLFTLKGVSELGEYDEAGVMAKYGVPANRYADFAILRGDPSDSLPGVRGVGEKTARALTNAYDSLDHLLAEANAERRSPGPLQGAGKLVATLRDSGDYLDAMRKIVPIRTDVDVDLTREAGDEDRLDELAKSHRLAGPLERLHRAIGA